jgi:hypothetical protein
VAGDDTTRDRPVAKYLWLMYVRQRTNWISLKETVADGTSAPYVFVLKNSITNRITSNFLFCKKPTHFHLFSKVNSSIYRMNCYSFSRDPEYETGFEVMARYFPYFYQLLCSLNGSSSQCFPHFPKLKIFKNLNQLANMLK